VAMRVREQRTVLAQLRQEGCLKARFPHSDGWPEVVSLNTSGGIAGGDVLASAFAVGPGGRLTVATQAAERVYRALPDDAASRVRTTVAVGPGATAEWLPQETILFDRCALDRQLDVALAEGACFLGVEMLLFGRAAMGETVAQGRLRDTIRVVRDGALVLHDAIRLDGAIADTLARPAVAAGGRAVATLLAVADDAATLLDPLRAALAAFDAGASAWNGMLLARIVAEDGACLRAAVVAGLAVLRNGRKLPRVWMC